LAGVMTLLALWFSIVVATIPGEWRKFPLSYIAKIEPKAANRLVFGVVDPGKGVITGNWPYNTLRLQGFAIYEALKVDDPKKIDWKDHIFDLQNRRLEGAVFIGSKLGKVNLKNANLEGAVLYGAQLQGASLFSADLQGASLILAQLQGASLVQAQLQGASLYQAQLQGALLNSAKLQGAFLNSVQLQGASLVEAQLQGASLFASQLQGASLVSAEINATDFLGSIQWRTDWGLINPAKLGAVRLGAALSLWKPRWQKDINSSLVPWDAKAYAELRVSMNSIPEGAMRDAVLKRIERLDCANPDKIILASCDPAAKQ